MGPRLGVVYAPQRPVRELPEAARRVEALGFDELWVVEDCFLSGGLTAAATALAVTRRLRVGIGLLPLSVRNPAIAAMELGTLAHLHPRRLSVAFGHGVEAWMRQIGARPADRLVALSEVVTAIQGLLRGEVLSARGRFVELSEVQLADPPEHPPALLVGTTGERAISIARDRGLGVLLPEGSGAEAIAWVAGLLAGRGEITVYAWLSVDDDGEAARDRLLPVIREWSEFGLYPNLTARGGPAEDVAIAGTPRECAAAVARLAAAGASAIALLPVGPEPDRQLELLAAAVAR
jgi:alkanesulfonate monooxygenase SsuD/methylene tetrahydromethanopterin reductase-like flavin-dependent oxidoreductase (luciferase family)